MSTKETDNFMEKLMINDKIVKLKAQLARNVRTIHWGDINTVKPLHSGHHRDLEKVSAMRRCPLYIGLTFFSKEMTFRSLSSVLRYPH